MARGLRAEGGGGGGGGVRATNPLLATLFYDTTAVLHKYMDRTSSSCLPMAAYLDYNTINSIIGALLGLGLV